jgi:AbiV family abortive infection protein
MDQTNRDVEACLAHAHDLLRAAKRVLQDEQLPKIAFHLTVLALEETGKGALLGARAIVRAAENETIFIDNRLDDHPFKLFFALWTPSLAGGKDITREEFEHLRRLAKTMHEDRLAAMYVSPNHGDSPLMDVGEKRARDLLELAETRLAIEMSRDRQAIDLSGDSVTRWFLEAANEPEKRELIFGQKALDKLAELGHMRDWMVWLKEQFDQAEMQGRDNLQRELARTIPDVRDGVAPKWKVAIRLFSPSQSIRNRAIRSWNQQPSWIRLFTVNNEKHAVDVEFTFREAVSVRALGPLSYGAARMFVAAMNIGCNGFWWWQRAEQTEKFYQRLTDLKAPDGMMLDLRMHQGPRFEWQRRALDDADLQRVALCLGTIARLDEPIHKGVIDPYLAGLALFAKSDLHLNLAPQASQHLAACLLEAMRYFGDWDGTDEALPGAISGFFRPLFKQSEDEQKVLNQLHQLRRQPPDLIGITLERAAILKVLCDAYLIKQFDTMMAKPKDAREPSNAPAQAEPGGSSTS